MPLLLKYEKVEELEGHTEEEISLESCGCALCFHMGKSERRLPSVPMISKGASRDP